MGSKKAKDNGGIEEIISYDFQKVLKEVKSLLNGAKILDYKVHKVKVSSSSGEDSAKYKIIITKLKLPGGRILSKKNHSSYMEGYEKPYLEYVCNKENEHTPLIKRFKEKNNIESITWMD